MARIAYIAPEFGALTSTFIYREVLALRGLGYEVKTYSTLRPRDAVISDEARPLVDETLYLYDLPKPAVLAAAVRFGLRHPVRTGAVKAQVFRDMALARTAEPSDRPKMLWHFTVACALAERLEADGVRHLHSHFAHVGTAIAMYAAELAGITFSFTNHANDIFQRGAALKEKVARSAFTACISAYNVRFLTNLGCDPAKLHVVRCALNVDEYAYAAPKTSADPPVIFSVGRLIEKKGLEYLIDAVSVLRGGKRKVRCLIAGNGPLLDALQARVAKHELESQVEFLGSQPQERVRELLREADIFALPCVEAHDGDLDGIPVSLMEAMAMGVPVVSTGVSGIPELIHDGKNGLLTQPRDGRSLAAALGRLIDDGSLRESLAAAARQTIETEFEEGVNAKRLQILIDAALAR